MHFANSELGRPLRNSLIYGFVYGDCTVDDSRLVILNAKDAAERGAEICVGWRLTRAERQGRLWQAQLLQSRNGQVRSVAARALVNASGPWIGQVQSETLGIRDAAPVRLIKGSHIVVRKLYPGEQAYVLQNADRRIVFVIPYQDDFTLIGTTDVEWRGAPATVSISAEETDYLCQTVNAYFKGSIAPHHVVWSYAGIRSLCDDGNAAASALTRDYKLELDADASAAPLLSVFGGKITTYRPLAEQALALLAPHFPGISAPWTAAAVLPGGDFPDADAQRYLVQAGQRWPFLAALQLRRLVHAYGTRLERVLGPASSREALGQAFGGGLTQIEVDYLRREEWARTADDLYWRHTKTGLGATAADIQRLTDYLGTSSP